MNITSNKDNGFGGLGMIVLIAVIAVAGLTGWVVYKDSHKSSATVAITKQATATSVDPYSSWKTFASPSFGLRFKYPANWTVVQDPPGCGGIIQVGFMPATADIANAAAAINNNQLKKFTLLIEQSGAQSAECGPEGVDFNGFKYSYIKSVDKLTSGALMGDYLTFYDDGDANATLGLPDTGLVTTTDYINQTMFTDSGSVSANDQTFQFEIYADTGKYAQSPDPVEFEPSLLKNSTLYQKLLLVLNSMQ